MGVAEPTGQDGGGIAVGVELFFRDGGQPARRPAHGAARGSSGPSDPCVGSPVPPEPGNVELIGRDRRTDTQTTQRHVERPLVATGTGDGPLEVVPRPTGDEAAPVPDGRSLSAVAPEQFGFQADHRTRRRHLQQEIDEFGSEKSTTSPPPRSQPRRARTPSVIGHNASPEARSTAGPSSAATTAGTPTTALIS